MKKSNTKSFSRRHFLKAAGAAVVLPAILPGCMTAQGGKRVSANGKINMGIIGWGMQGPANTNSFLAEDDCRIVAACDLDKNALQTAVNTVNRHYGDNACVSYHDYHELFARTDLDAVMIAIPDHWHALVATAAAEHGLDIYGEKPLAKTIVEQRAIVHAVEKHNIIWQTGSWQRSHLNFHKGAEIVRNGLIGDVTHVEVGLPAGHTDFKHTAPELVKKLSSLGITDFSTIRPGSDAWNIAVTEPPPELDYETWIGPSRMEPYIKQRVHMDWRWNYNTGGGQLMDWIGHHCDIAHWGLGFDNDGPSEIEGQGEFPASDALWNTCTKYRIELKYPRNITMMIAGGHDDIKPGTKWIGTEGWVWVNRPSDSATDKATAAGFDCSNPDWKKGKSLPEELRKIKLYESPGHWRNFLDCVKSRQPTIAPAQTAHHSAIPGHLGLISMLTGRKINWSVQHEKIIGDDEASKLLSRQYRAPYKLV
ncbi:MAG TPA: Gfo/Idh/MocA family oxidoreductase [Candidatus Sulfotelmatobacter sp.]|jgi:predicted dehydrogenase|nr:Gfo/Idh/MocA family oxidoreductase [Candidatus Sulfotelmatobacter sp.]